MTFINPSSKEIIKRERIGEKKQQAKLGFFNFLLLGSLILLTLKTSEFHFRGGRTLKNIELRDSKNSFKLMSRIQQKSRNESQKTPRFSLKSVTHLQSSAHKHKMPTSKTRGNKKMPFSTGTMPQLEN